jgi:hypothetical protein
VCVQVKDAYICAAEGLKPATDQLPSMTFRYGVWNKEQAVYSSNWHELVCVVIVWRSG